MMTLCSSWTFYGNVKFALLTAEDYGMKDFLCPLTKNNVKTVPVYGRHGHIWYFFFFFLNFTTAIRLEILLYRNFFGIINDYVISHLIL